jgi:N-acyl-D-amino-acid deacylase
VRKLTGDPAAVFGMKNRGKLETGFAADLLLFDPATVGRGAKQRVHDLPGGGARLTTPGIGVHGVWVNGMRVADEKGTCASERHPGKLLRDFHA